MRLVVDHSLAAYNVRVTCLICGKLYLLSHVVIDKDGPSFKAYYCPEHVPVNVPIEPCSHIGCRRVHIERRTI